MTVRLPCLLCLAPWMLLGVGCQPSEGGKGLEVGTPDGGGADAGVSCLELPHHPQLGTLQLQPGFTIAEAVALPQGLTALTAVPRHGGFDLYGVRGTDKSLHALGTWPHLTLGDTPLQYVVAPEDRTRTVFLSGFLVNDGRRLLTGYIRSGASGDGRVLVHDLDDSTRSHYVPAPGNTSAAAGASAFLVNGMGLEALGAPGDEAAIYALSTGSSPFQAVKLALFEEAWAPASGRSAMTANGIALFGYLSAWDEQEHLHAVPPSVHEAALAHGTPFRLADWPEVHAGSSEGLSVAGFGDGVAVHRTRMSESSGTVETLDVIRIPLTLGSGTEPPLRVGPPVPVLVSPDACTQVGFLVPMGQDLLVGVSDSAGGRLVRVQGEPPASP